MTMSGQAADTPSYTRFTLRPNDTPPFLQIHRLLPRIDFLNIGSLETTKELSTNIYLGPSNLRHGKRIPSFIHNSLEREEGMMNSSRIMEKSPFLGNQDNQWDTMVINENANKEKLAKSTMRGGGAVTKKHRDFYFDNNNYNNNSAPFTDEQRPPVSIVITPSRSLHKSASKKSLRSTTTTSTKKSRKSKMSSTRRRRQQQQQHKRKTTPTPWRETSPKVQKEWIMAVITVIAAAREMEDIDFNSLGSCSEQQHQEGGGRSVHHHSAAVAEEADDELKIMTMPNFGCGTEDHYFPDDASVASLDLLFHWLTCREGTAAVLEDDGGGPGGMVISAQPQEDLCVYDHEQQQAHREVEDEMQSFFQMEDFVQEDEPGLDNPPGGGVDDFDQGLLPDEDVYA